MSKPSFDIHLTGDGLAPETVSITDLAQILVETETAILAAADGLPSTDGKPIVSLVNIEEGSCELTLALDPRLSTATSRISKAIVESKFKELPSAAWQALAAISKFVIKRAWTFAFQSKPSLHLKKSVICADHPVPEPDTFAANGTTTIYGRCLRVGGIEPKVEVLLADGARLHVSVSEAMARKLAQRLYEQVALEGEAVWDSKTWRITAFRATRILDYQPTSLSAAFEGLAQIAGERWQGIDADQHVERLRNAAEGNR